MNYRYGSHTVYKVQYRTVFVTKYRDQVPERNVSLKTLKLISQICEALLWAQDRRQLPNAVTPNGSIRPVSGLSVRNFNPSAFCWWLLSRLP